MKEWKLRANQRGKGFKNNKRGRRDVRLEIDCESMSVLSRIERS